MKVFTKTISSPITLLRSSGAFRISIKAVGGTVSIVGSESFQGLESDAIDLLENESLTITSQSAGDPIEGLTITPSVSADLLISKN